MSDGIDPGHDDPLNPAKDSKVHVFSDASLKTPSDAVEILRALDEAKRLHMGAIKRRHPETADSTDEDPQFAWLQQHLTAYEMIGRLDRGGQGIVYEAIHRESKERVAIKVLVDGDLSTEQQRYRFEREVAIISHLNHRNIVRLRESGIVEKRRFLVMEFVEGYPIDDYMLLNRPSVRDRVALFQKICDAVASAHQRGVIHRDLKPGNILIDRSAEPHILDFGMAKHIDEDGALGLEHVTVSVAGQLLGTPPFVSPEQAAGRSQDVSTQSDIYSLGVIFYLSLTGVMPYDVTGTREQVLDNIQNITPMKMGASLPIAGDEQYTDAVTIDDDLEIIVARAMAKAPQRRYPSAGAMGEDFRCYLAGVPIAAKADSAWYVVRQQMQRYRRQMTFAAVVVLLLTAGILGTALMWRRADKLRQDYFKSLQAAGLQNRAAAVRDGGRIDESIALQLKSLEISSTIAHPDGETLRFIVQAHLDIAILLLSREQPREVYQQATSTQQRSDTLNAEPVQNEEAAQHADAALNLARDYLQSHPDDLLWKELLAAALYLKGDLLLRPKWPSASALDEAKAYLEESLELRDFLARSDPNNMLWQSDFIATLKKMGWCHQKMGKLNDAQTYVYRAYEIACQLYERDPDSLDRLIDLCDAEKGVAMWNMKHKRLHFKQTAVKYFHLVLTRLDEFKKTHIISARSGAIDGLYSNIEVNLEIMQKKSRVDVSRADTPVLPDDYVCPLQAGSLSSTGSASPSSIGSSSPSIRKENVDDPVALPKGG